MNEWYKILILLELIHCQNYLEPNSERYKLKRD